MRTLDRAFLELNRVFMGILHNQPHGSPKGAGAATVPSLGNARSFDHSHSAGAARPRDSALWSAARNWDGASDPVQSGRRVPRRASSDE